MNKRCQRTGTLFGERFKAKAVQSEELLAHLLRYIHRNPVEAGLAGSPGDWKFSDYLEWIGKRRPTVGGGLVESPYFSDPDQYKHFVLEYEPSEVLDQGLRKYFNG